MCNMPVYIYIFTLIFDLLVVLIVTGTYIYISMCVLCILVNVKMGSTLVLIIHFY